MVPTQRMDRGKHDDGCWWPGVARCHKKDSGEKHKPQSLRSNFTAISTFEILLLNMPKRLMKKDGVARLGGRQVEDVGNGDYVRLTNGPSPTISESIAVGGGIVRRELREPGLETNVLDDSLLLAQSEMRLSLATSPGDIMGAVGAGIGPVDAPRL